MTDRELFEMALEALMAMQSYAAAEKKGLRICDEAIETLRAALAQPEKERDRGGACVVVNGTSGVFTIHLPGNPSGGGISPAPQREWVGLTDEERNEIINFIWMPLNKLEADVSMTISRAIEAKLREKNCE